MSRALIVIVGGMIWSICAFNSQSEHEQCPKVTYPVSGQMVNKKHTTDYKGSKIAFCCGKAESAADKVALLFQDAAFAKGFEVKKPE